MKRILLAVAMLCAVPAMAQHEITVGWRNSPDTNNTFLYRIAGPCPTPIAGFTKITASPVTTATYTDLVVNAGTTYAYYATAFLNNVESVPSNCVSATVPVAQPTGLTLTSVALTTTGNTETVLARWTDTSGTQQDFRFSNGALFIAQGLTSSQNGVFAERWTGPAGTPITFIACNATGQCASQAAK